jgi:hypothetical protein
MIGAAMLFSKLLLSVLPTPKKKRIGRCNSPIRSLILWETPDDVSVSSREGNVWRDESQTRVRL